MTIAQLWPRDLAAREAEIPDAELQSDKAPPPSLARIEKMLSHPNYWQGAANVRSDMLLDEPMLSYRGMARAHQIQAELLAGKPLREISGYRDWLAMRVSR